MYIYTPPYRLDPGDTSALLALFVGRRWFSKGARRRTRSAPPPPGRRRPRSPAPAPGKGEAIEAGGALSPEPPSSVCEGKAVAERRRIWALREVWYKHQWWGEHKLTRGCHKLRSLFGSSSTRSTKRGQQPERWTPFLSAVASSILCLIFSLHD